MNGRVLAGPRNELAVTESITELLPRTVDPLLFERVLCRPVVLIKHPEDAWERQLRELVRR